MEVSTEKQDGFIYVDFEGTIEIDEEGIVHCNDVVFADAMAQFEGCRCLVKKYKDNSSESKYKYPYFGFYPYSIDYSQRGIVEEREDGKLFVGRFLFSYNDPSDITVGTAIEITRIRPFVKKGERCIGNILKYRVIESDQVEKVDAEVCFLIDTNVFIKCPTIFEYINAERPAIVEGHVLSELDGLKKSYDVSISQAAQRAHNLILEASKQKKVVYAKSEPPYLHFKDQELTTDQKIIETAFLKQFCDSTVVLITDDRNLLLQAESVRLQGIGLDDFLKGNYTIKGKESDLNLPGLNAIKKPSQYKENLKKDLARKYDEYFRLFERLEKDTFSEFKEETVDNPAVAALRNKRHLYLAVLPPSLTIMYDCVMHLLLFNEWDWQEKREWFIKNGYFTYKEHDPEELYNALTRVNQDVVCLLIDKLECPLGTKKTLKTSILNKEKDGFVKTLGYLDCDLSLLQFFADYASLPLALIVGFIIDPEAVHDFIYHFDYGKLTDALRKKNLFSFIEEAESVIDEETLSAFIMHISQSLDQEILGMLRLVKMYVDETQERTRLFSFEKKYFEDFYSNPDLKPYWEKILNEPVAPIEQESPKEEKPKEEIKNSDKPHWPTDEELLGYEDNYNTSEYFPYTIFGPAGHVKASEIKKLFEILSSEYVLDDNLETRLIFLARYSGKIIPGLVLRPLKWAMVKDREGALGYLILKTANGDYATGRFFFYFDANGKKELPKGVIGPYAHNWDNLGPQGSSKKSLKMKLDEFLINF